MEEHQDHDSTELDDLSETEGDVSTRQYTSKSQDLDIWLP
jgi:hypothetical protein